MNRAAEYDKYAAQIILSDITGRAEAARVERTYIDDYYIQNERNPNGNLIPKRKLWVIFFGLNASWGKYNIRANVICQGLIETKFSEALWNNEKILKYFLSQLPLGRVGQSDEIAGLALFLASDASGYCTGGVFVADGVYLV